MAARSQSYHKGFAATLENARNSLASMKLDVDNVFTPRSTSPETPGTPVSPEDIPTADTFAFAFDIDGVLVRGGKPIPAALEAMKVLNGDNEYGLRV